MSCIYLGPRLGHLSHIFQQPPTCSRWVVWPAVQVIFLIPGTMAGFDFFSHFSFFSYASILWIWRHGLCYAPRLSGIGAFAMFFSLKSYWILMTDILWHDLHKYVWYCSYNVRVSPPSASAFSPTQSGMHDIPEPQHWRSTPLWLCINVNVNP